MAAVRAQIMHARISASILGDGLPFAATISAPIANGKAKIVWEKRISRRNRVKGLPKAAPDLGNGFFGFTSGFKSPRLTIVLNAHPLETESENRARRKAARCSDLEVSAAIAASLFGSNNILAAGT